jgi:hypothetical protein
MLYMLLIEKNMKVQNVNLLEVILKILLLELLLFLEMIVNLEVAQQVGQAMEEYLKNIATGKPLILNIGGMQFIQMEHEKNVMKAIMPM